MNQDADVQANFWNESTGHCDCCGRQSKTIWGDLADSSGARAVYFVQWTVNSPEHMANFDLVLGPWGDGTSPSDRVLVSLLYRPRPGGGSFMVTSGKGRRADDRSLCDRALERADVVGTPLAGEVFSLVDALWRTEPRVEEIRALDSIASHET
ncbi:hypothetical protein [Pseudoduganella lutea]|uniref:Uncharacterized protein n=1 Tax=Pseudoduganella lutea TaxID=321985 RepID=A0A4P6L3L1_9BURK|nr:hypothetical protein [Pseudoduganella lutea]QBE66027.1 hypothetical protein EWM63_26085 [Pseudoduganella lutea]